jgi:hypothetical protein
MIRDGLETAERNIPKGHIAFLMARTIHAQVLVKLKKYDEAESMFYALVNKALYRQFADGDGEHPDRLSNLWLLFRCLEEQGKDEEQLRVGEDLLLGLATIGGQGAGLKHQILRKVQKKIPELRERLQVTKSASR